MDAFYYANEDIRADDGNNERTCLEQVRDLIIERLGQDQSHLLSEDIVGTYDMNSGLINDTKKSIESTYMHDKRFISIDFPGSSDQLRILHYLMQGKYRGCDNLLINCLGNNSVIFYGQTKNVEGLSNKFPEANVENNKTKCTFEFPDGKQFTNGANTILDYAEQQVIGYNRLITQKDIHGTADLGGIKIHQLESGAEFAKAAATARKANTYGTFFVPRSPEEYSNMKCFIANSGAGGLAVKGNEITSVFKNPKIAKNDRLGSATISTLMIAALRNGGKILDCYDGFLPDFYMQFGFVPVGYKEFNDQWAPDGWNFDRDGRPNLIFMLHSGISLTQTFWEHETEKLPSFKDYEGKIPKFHDYDSAFEARAAILSDENKMEEVRKLREQIKQEKIKSKHQKRTSFQKAI